MKIEGSLDNEAPQGARLISVKMTLSGSGVNWGGRSEPSVPYFMAVDVMGVYE